jgi:hypothetical protein
MVCFLKVWYRLRRERLWSRLGRRMCPFEFGSVRPHVKFNPDRRVVGDHLVILVQSSAHFSSLYPNHRIIAGCIPDRTLKEVHSYSAFFEPLVIPLKTVMDYVRQKLLATLACLKDRAGQDRVQFAKDLGPFKIIEVAVLAVD